MAVQETEICFNTMRDDWYRANQLVPRRFRDVLSGRALFRFCGFPRQWIPLFEYFGMPWRDCCAPTEYMPIVSGISDEQLAGHCRAARQAGTLRTLVESIVILDPVLADFLYILDNTTHYDPEARQPREVIAPDAELRLTGWQSYGRPEVLAFEAEVDRICKFKSTAVLLPCSRHRPYRNSRTHKKIWRALGKIGYKPEDVDQLVVTSLGIVPERLWEYPVVMRYDAGVPDIYRVLRLARRFFRRNRYMRVLDCLQFAPYSNVFSILRLEKIIRGLSRGPVNRSRQFYLKA